MSRILTDELILRGLLDHLPGGVAVVDASASRVVASNSRAEAVLGAGAAALLDGAGGGPAARARAALAAALAGGRPGGDELVTDGDRWWRIRASALRDATGAIHGGVVSIDDCTDELRARPAGEATPRAGDDLLAILAHDLRGPLSSIHVAADGLRELDLGPSERGRYLDAIQRSVQRADRLIKDLMDTRQIEAGKLAVEPRSIRVRELLEQCARDHELAATQAGSRVVVDVAAGVDRVDADRDRLLQALANLIQNALRHGRPTAQVELSASLAAAGGVELAVSDHGPGIPPEAAAHVFDRSWQPRNRRGGPGLGLAIVRGIVVAHGGTVSAGPAPGGGTRITMVLPVRPSATAS
ncbi:MAG TPA: HAMP domain-containing sensor histidine kinase [Kofleriaceae bacterium]|nr:HAMP domain-containing sensor histidine kinase [Kofleriaceae bacterium]